MGQQPKELTPERSPLHRWGYELRELRIARGLPLRQLAAKALIDHSHLGRFERAERNPSREQVVRLDTVLEAGGALIRRWDDIESSCGHVAKDAEHVAKARTDLAPSTTGEAASDEGIFVPARLRDGTVIFVALDRRAMLRGGVSLGAAAALGVGAQPAAASDTAPGLARRAQAAAAYGATPVEHLRRARRLLIDSDNLLGPGQAIQRVHDHIEAIKILRADSSGEDRRNLMELQTQYAEFLAWLYQDLGDLGRASYWLDRAFQWSHSVGDGDLTSYVMARKAQLAGDSRDVADIVDLAEAAHSMARPRSRLAAIARTYEAVGHALRGNSAASQRAIDDVRNRLDSVVADPSPWGVWLNEAYVEVHRAQCLEVLGRHDQAADSFASAIALLPEGYHRDRGVYLAREAVARAGAGVPEQAAATGLEALAVAADTGSGRIVNELARLDKALVPRQRDPHVAQFRSTFDSMLMHEQNG